MNVSQEEKKTEEIMAGEIKYSNDCFYEGQYMVLNGKKVKNGTGRIIFQTKFRSQTLQETYLGEWKNDLKCGNGVYSYINGASYDGKWVDDLQDGMGIYLFADGSYYEGEWKEHKMHGKGVYVDTKGKKWTGEFRNGTFNSGNQIELKKSTLKKEKIELFENNLKRFLSSAELIVEKDRKNVKDFLKKNLAVEIAPEMSDILSEKLVKFEEKKTDHW